MGRGLDALIKGGQDGPRTEEVKDRSAVIRELEERLQNVRAQMNVDKRKVEDLRQNLTIQLLLDGKVDRSPLTKAEEDLKALIETKDRLEKDYIRLKGEMVMSVGPDVPMTGPGAEMKKPTSSSDLDMRMVRELIGPLVERGPMSEPPPKDKDYINRLKEELSPRKEAHKVRMEARRESPRLDSLPLLVTGESEEDSLSLSRTEPAIRIETLGTPPPARKPIARRTMAPRRVRVQLTGPTNEVVEKDKRLYDVIDTAVHMMENGDPLGAKDALLAALREYPKDDELLYHLGNALFIMGDLDNAEIRFRRAIERNPSSYRALNNLGVVLRKKGKREQAIRAFNQSLEVNNRYERAWYNLGAVFMEITPPLLKEAQVFLKRALECDPDYRKAKEKLEECERMLKGAT